MVRGEAAAHKAVLTGHGIDAAPVSFAAPATPPQFVGMGPAARAIADCHTRAVAKAPTGDMVAIAEAMTEDANGTGLLKDLAEVFYGARIPDAAWDEDIRGRAAERIPRRKLDRGVPRRAPRQVRDARRARLDARRGGTSPN